MVKAKVNYALTPSIDVGMIADKFADGTIEVDKDFWATFCTARYKYEVLYEKLKKEILRKDSKLRQMFNSYGRDFGWSRKPR